MTRTVTIAKNRPLKFFKVLCHKSHKETLRYLLQQPHDWLPLGELFIFHCVKPKLHILDFLSLPCRVFLALPWQSVQAHTNIITKFSHIHKFPLSRAMDAPPCVHRLQQSEWSDISNVPTVILFGIQSLHGCNPHGGGHQVMGTYSIVVLSFFSCGISVILILTCGIAVSSSSAVCGFSSFWLTVFSEIRLFTVLQYHLFVLSFQYNMQNKHSRT